MITDLNALYGENDPMRFFALAWFNGHVEELCACACVCLMDPQPSFHQIIMDLFWERILYPPWCIQMPIYLSITHMSSTSHMFISWVSYMKQYFSVSHSPGATAEHQQRQQYSPIQEQNKWEAGNVKIMFFNAQKWQIRFFSFCRGNLLWTRSCVFCALNCLYIHLSSSFCEPWCHLAF